MTEITGKYKQPKQAGRPLTQMAAILHLLAASICLIPCGCNLIGIAAYKTVGPPPIDAKYVPAKEPMLILVENYRNPNAVRLDAERLGRYIAQEIERWDIAPTVDPIALEQLRTKPDFKTMTQSQIGRALGAKQILYVDLQVFDIENALGGGMIKGKAELTCRIVDAESGHSLWPSDVGGGFPQKMETPYAETNTPGGGMSDVAMREQMCAKLAHEMGKLFRRYRPDYDNEEASQSP